MSSILDINSGSSDSEDDQDYVPTKEAVSDESEEEINEEDNDSSGAPTPKKIKLDGPTVDKVADIEPTIGKEATDSIWRDFLKGVDAYSSSTQKKTVASGLKVSNQSETNSSDLSTAESKIPEKTVCERSFPEDEVTSESVVKNETASDDLLKEKKEIPCEKIVDLDNSADRSEKSKPSAAEVELKTAKKGLASILGVIAKKDKKVTVLEKSLLDWRNFKKEEGIEKDLETFNKGKQGFIERQRFLERSDLRLFESEKSARLSVSKR